MFKVLSILAIAAALIMPAFADTPAGVVLPAKTLVLVVVVNHLKSGVNQTGDDVLYKVVANVYGPGRSLLIPAESEGHGKITKSTGAGMAGKSGKLEYTCDYVLAADNSHIAFADSDLSKAGRSFNATRAVLIDGPLSLFDKGKNIDVNEGEPFVMAVAADTSVVPSTTVPTDVTVTIIPNKHKGKKMSGTVKSFDAETVTFTVDGVDKVMKLKDIKQILLP